MATAPARPMEVGLLNFFGSIRGESEAETFRRCMEEVLATERLGFDAVWLGEFHFSELGVSSAPLIIASAVAQLTNRLTIGTAIAMVPLANPVQMAEMANTVDQLSAGRFHLGIGRGTGIGYEGYGYPYNPRTAENRQRFLECVDIIMKCLREDSFNYNGEFYKLQDVAVRPRSCRRPHLPLSASAGPIATYKAMGERGANLLIGATLPGNHGYLGGANTYPEARERIRAYRDAWRDTKQFGESMVTVRVPCFVAKSRSAAVAGISPGLQWSQDHAISILKTLEAHPKKPGEIDPEWLRGIQNRASTPVEEIVDTTALAGTPAEVRDGLTEIVKELSPDALILEMNLLQQTPLPVALEAYKLCAEEVLPFIV